MNKYENGQIVGMTAQDIQQLQQLQNLAQQQEKQNAILRIRLQRNELLQQSDWTQLPDADLTPEKKLEWTQYRQQLRNLMSSVIDPELVQFPQKPQ
jgi:hypothetical protein